VEYSAFGVIHKTQLPDGSYAPAHRLNQKQRSDVVNDLKQTRTLRTKYGLRGKPNNDLAGQVLRFHSGPKVPESEIPKLPLGDKRSSAFKEGVKRRLGYVPKIDARPHGTPGVLASVTPTPKGVRMNYNPRGPVQNDYDAKSTGVHESAHYATDSQLRRGKKRSPYRLTQISLDPMKLAREEGRADGTAARYFPNASPNGYARGEIFEPDEQKQYEKIKTAMKSKKVKVLKPIARALAS